MSDLLCFHVSGSDDPEDDMIVFEPSSISAKRRWANEYGAGDRYIAGISAKRCKGWDKYAPGPVPPLEMIEDGWQFECSGCYTTISSDYIGEPIDDDPDQPDMEPVQEGCAVWCCPSCRDRHKAEQARIKRMKLRAIAVVKAAILSTYPGVVFPDREYSNHAYVARTRGRLLIHQVFVQFEAPGMAHGGCCLRINDEKWRYERVRPEGPPELCNSDSPKKVSQPIQNRVREVRLDCANGDQDVWKAWLAEQTAVAA